MNGLTWNIMLALIWVGMTGNFTGSGMAIGFLLGYLLLGVTLRDVPRFSGYIRKAPESCGSSSFSCVSWWCPTCA